MLGSLITYLWFHIGCEVLPPVELTIKNSKWNVELIENTGVSVKGILAKNSDGRQTNSEFKPGQAGLVLGWVTTFIQ